MKNRVEGLTGIRGVAALAVLLYHLHFNPAFAQYNFSLTSRAYLAVDLFFILSGFVLSMRYDGLRMKSDAAAYFGFLLNRIARVYPLHLVVVTAATVRLFFGTSGSGALLTAPQLLANFTMSEAWGFGTPAVSGALWSVSTEAMAYLVFPLLTTLARVRPAWQTIGLAVIGYGTIAVFGDGSESMMDVASLENSFPLFRCLCGFAVGIVTHRAFTEGRLEAMRSDRSFYAVLLALGVAFMVPNSDLAIVATFPALVVALAHDGRAARAVFGNKVMAYLGLISYSLYLWHPLARDGLGHAYAIAQTHHVAIPIAVVVAVYVGGMIIVADISYRLIEVRGRKIVLALRTRVMPRRGQEDRRAFAHDQVGPAGADG
ncbi:acyltransferase family protein [Sphingomonas morindae]|uniref:Acyltransferase n=1 Tax=Sphingomonas morindae TaxID=1541170 RepID=A0ABY4X7P2_9SPHN|nr:acyltransferase [Sphingomonas morindae]USI72972.1 acyltransferase [Sphingomonas morindae]